MNNPNINGFVLLAGSVASAWVVGRAAELVFGWNMAKHIMHAAMPIACLANIVNAKNPRQAALPWVLLAALVGLNEFFIALPGIGTALKAIRGSTPASSDILYDTACAVLSGLSFYYPSASLIAIGSLFSDAAAAIAGRVTEPKTLWAKLTRPMAIAEAAAVNVGVMGFCMFAWALGVLLYRSGFVRRGAGGRGFSLNVPPFELLHALGVAFPVTLVQSVLARLPFVHAAKYWVVPLVGIAVHQGIQFLRNQFQLTSVGRKAHVGAGAGLTERITRGAKEVKEEVAGQAPGIKDTKQQDIKQQHRETATSTAVNRPEAAKADIKQREVSGKPAWTAAASTAPKPMYNKDAGVSHVPTGESTGQFTGQETTVR